MADRSSKKTKRPRDFNQRALEIVREATADKQEAAEPESEKNPAAVALGRLGGLKGGKARAESLSPERRREIAQLAAAARWKKSEG